MTAATASDTADSPADPPAAGDRGDPARRLDDAFAAEEIASLRLLMIARLAVTAAISVYLIITFPNLGGLYFIVLTMVFGGVGIVQYALARAGRTRFWHKFAWVTFDVALVTFIILGGNPLLPEDFPLAQRLRYPNFDFMYLVVAVLALSYTPATVAWMGAAAVLCWGGFVVWGLTFPETVTEYTIPGFRDLPVSQQIEIAGRPHFIDLSGRFQQGFIMLVFAGVLAAGVWRSRRLVRRQVNAERARAQLSRYFSPAIVDEILTEDADLHAGRTQPATVMFADIVGFTALAESLPPDRVMDLLREFHRRTGAIIFENRGTIDKYIGDEVMATFGTPRPGPDDAGDALRCALGIQTALDDWNRQRAAAGEPAVRIGIGIHHGDVVIGDIGDDRRLEFAVIGDTVNVASRLQRLTRDHDTGILFSGDVQAAASGEAASSARRIGSADLRGRRGQVELWTL